MTPNPETSTVQEAARALGWTLKYIYDLIYSGRIAAKKIGRRWRIPKAEVDARFKERGDQ